jgi:hypothetical protein
MDSTSERNNASPLSGNLLRLSERHEVAIYLRDGTAWVAEFKNGHGEVSTVGAWFTFHGRVLIQAQRRGGVEIISPIPDDVVAWIERLHRGTGVRNAIPDMSGLRSRQRDSH